LLSGDLRLVCYPDSDLLSGPRNPSAIAEFPTCQKYMFIGAKLDLSHVVPHCLLIDKRLQHHL
jgi:hypothetical protein